jgi:hypothetical protein
VDVTAMTDDTGNLMLPGAKQSIGEYHITVTKDGYEMIETIDPSSVIYTATDIPASVVGGMMNVKSIIQDKLSSLKIFSVDSLDVPLPGVNFHVEGGRILGYDMLISPAAPEYNLELDSTTDAQGEKEFEDISPGQIFISPIGSPEGYSLVDVSHYTDYDSLKNEFSFILSPDEARNIKLKYADNDAVSLLITIKKDSDSTIISDAKVTLSNLDGYSEEIIVKKKGTAFFPGTSAPLVLGNYSIKVLADGYNDYTEENIAVDKLILKEIKMTAL